MTKVGFIGLGSQGAPIARRIARSGFDLVVCDVVQAALDAFDEPGVSKTLDPLEVAEAVDLLAVCVRDDADMRSLAAGGRLFDALGKGNVLLIHSTLSPGLCRDLAVEARERGCWLVDAGVSGGGPAAIEGKLSLFVGGDAEAVEKARPLMESYSARIEHYGEVGRGMEGKLLNNLLTVANFGMGASILDLGGKLGFDVEQLHASLMAGSAQSFALRSVPGMLSLNRPGAQQGIKDLRGLLKKDVDLARGLADDDNVALRALLASADRMIDRLAEVGQESAKD